MAVEFKYATNVAEILMNQLILVLNYQSGSKHSQIKNGQRN